MTAHEVVQSQAEIDREIAKLKEDSARDVQRQLEQQRRAEKESKVEEEVKEVVAGVEHRFAPAWRAAEQELETVIKDVDVDVKDMRRSRGREDGVKRE